MLIISDGGDNHSRYTENEIKSLVKEADVMIYAIGIYDRYASAAEERLGPQLLSDITELTGGRAFTIDNPNDLARCRHENWRRVTQPIRPWIPSQQSSTRRQMA